MTGSIEVRTTTNDGSLGGVPDLSEFLTGGHRVRELMQRGILTLELGGAREKDWMDQIQYGHILRCTRIPMEHRVTEVRRERSGSRAPSIKAEAVWMDLKDTILRRYYDDGRVRSSFTLIRKTPTEILGYIFEQTRFNAGAARLPTEKKRPRTMQFSHQTPLGALQQLTSEVDCEWAVRTSVDEDDGGRAYHIDLVEEVGEPSGSTPAVIYGSSSGAGIANRLRLTQRKRAPNYFSRLIPTLRGREGLVTMGDALWGVAAQAGDGALTLEGQPVVFDGWGVGAFFGNDDAGWHRITGSKAPSEITVASGSDLSGVKGSFASEGDGTRLDFARVPGVESVYGVTEKVEQVQGSPHANLIREAGHSDDMTQFASGKPVGMGLVGSATVSRYASEKITQGVGQLAAQVEAGVGEGLQFGPYEPNGEYLSAMAGLLLQNGAVRMQMVDQNGNTFPSGEQQATTNSKTLRSLKLGVWEDFEGAVSVEITAVRPETILVLDWLTFTVSNGSQEWQPVMGPRDLHREALRRANEKAGRIYNDLEAQAIDLSMVDNVEGYERIEVGAPVEVRGGDDEVALMTRVARERRELASEAAEEPTVTLKRVPDSLVDVLAGTPPRQPYEPPSEAPWERRKPPLLEVNRTDRVQVEDPSGTGTTLGARFEIAPRTASGDEPLTNWTLHRFDRAAASDEDAWPVIATDDDVLTSKAGETFYLGTYTVPTREDPLPVVEVPYPALDDKPTKVRLYVKDRATNLQSGVQELVVESATPTVRAEKEQDEDEEQGVLRLHVHDPVDLVSKVQARMRSKGELTGDESWQDLTLTADGVYEARVALGTKHTSQIAWRALMRGDLDTIGNTVTFDFNTQAEVRSAALDWDPSAKDVRARGAVDEDARAVAWATDPSDAQNITDSDFADAMSAGQYANTSATFDEVVASGVERGAARHVVFRPFAEELSSTHDGTSAAGPDTTRILKTPSKTQDVPRASVEVDQDDTASPTEAVMRLTVTDPEDLLAGVDFRTASGRELLPSDDWTAPDDTGSGVYEKRVALGEGHNSFIQYRLTLTDNLDPVVSEPVAFDPDTIPDATFTYRLAYDDDADAYDVLVGWQGNEDTASVHLELRDAQGNTEAQQVANGRRGDVTLGTVTPGATFQLVGRGYAEADGEGAAQPDDWQVTDTPITPAPTRPTTETTMDQSAGVGALSLEVSDPDELLDHVEARTASGRNLTPPDAWNTISPSASGTYEETVSLAENHNSYVQYRLVLTGSFQPITLDPVAFDADTIPDVSYNYSLAWDEAIEAYEVTLIWQGGEDTAGIEYSINNNTGTEPGRSGSVAVGNAEPEEQFSLEARGYSEYDASTGEVGGNAEPPPTWSVTATGSEANVNMPHAEVTLDQDSSAAYLYLTIRDPSSLVERVEARTASGRNLTPSDGWTEISTSLSASVALAEGHTSQIQYRLVLTGEYDTIQPNPLTFDSDDVPDPSFSYDYKWAGSGFQITLRWQGDEDTASIQAELQDEQGGRLEEVNQNGRTGSYAFQYQGARDETVQISALGYSGTDQSGEPQANRYNAEFTLPSQAPGVDAPDVAGLLGSSQLTASAQQFSSDVQFSNRDPTGGPLEADRVYWTTGTVDLADGQSVSIDAGNTPAMTDPTYIYLDTSEDAASGLQTTTAHTDAVGDNILLLCVCRPASNPDMGAFFLPANGAAGGGMKINADQVTANQLSAIVAFMGSLVVNEQITVGARTFLETASAASGQIDGLRVQDADGVDVLKVGDFDGAADAPDPKNELGEMVNPGFEEGDTTGWDELGDGYVTVIEDPDNASKKILEIDQFENGYSYVNQTVRKSEWSGHTIRLKFRYDMTDDPNYFFVRVKGPTNTLTEFTTSEVGSGTETIIFNLPLDDTRFTIEAGIDTRDNTSSSGQALFEVTGLDVWTKTVAHLSPEGLSVRNSPYNRMMFRIDEREINIPALGCNQLKLHEGFEPPNVSGDGQVWFDGTHLRVEQSNGITRTVAYQ